MADQPPQDKNPIANIKFCLETAINSLQQADTERQHLVRLLSVLLKKQGGEVVITHAEVQDIMPNDTVRQTDQTELGFKLSLTRIG